MNDQERIEHNERESRKCLTRGAREYAREEYTRCAIASMLSESSNPNQRGHTGPLTKWVIYRWIRGEDQASREGHDICKASAQALRALARKFL